jgi:hypothetical protein
MYRGGGDSKQGMSGKAVEKSLEILQHSKTVFFHSLAK